MITGTASVEDSLSDGGTGESANDLSLELRVLQDEVLDRQEGTNPRACLQKAPTPIHLCLTQLADMGANRKI